MSTQVLRRRGSTVDHSTFIGGAGELTVDTDKNVGVIHNAALAGGFPLAGTMFANIFSQPQTIAVVSGAPTIAFDIQTDGVSRVQFRKSGFGVFHRQEPDVSPGGLELTKRGTTGNALAALSSGSAISTIDWLGWDGAALGGAGGIRMFTTQAWVPGAHGSKLFFTTVPAGSTSTVNSMELDNTALTVLSRLLLPNTTSATVGGIYFGGSRAFHNFGTNNIFVGVNAGNFTMTGTGNSGVGLNALSVNTTGTNNAASGINALQSNTTGDANSAYGNNTLSSNTSGSNNSATGAGALDSNTTGNTNSAYGVNALGANMTGSDGSAFGVSALLSNTTGTQNSAFGVSALRLNISGPRNSAFGTIALQESTTGDGNGAFGVAALSKNTTGSFNNAFGVNALQLNTTASFNNAFGVNALLSNLTGANNNAFGFAALLLATGSNNVAFGHQAGNNITTGSNNLILGYDIDAPSATGSNQMSIGNLIFGTGIDGTGTTISSGNIGIGVITALDKLHVNGRLRVNTGFFNDAGGFKHARVTTGSVGAGSTVLVTITWTTAFADTNYTVNASVLEATTSSLSMSVVHIESITAAAVTVRVLNNAVGSLTGTVHVIAVHD